MKPMAKILTLKKKRGETGNWLSVRPTPSTSKGSIEPAEASRTAAARRLPQILKRKSRILIPEYFVKAGD
jgi:hypothetical protein